MHPTVIVKDFNSLKLKKTLITKLLFSLQSHGLDNDLQMWLLLTLFENYLRPKKLIISLALPRALLPKWPHFTTFCRVCIFLDKFHQQLNQFTQIILRLCRNYMLEKRFTKVNSMNKHLIRNLRLKFLLHMPSPFTK